MSLALTAEEQAIAAGRDGKGAAMAMRIVAESARLLGAPRLIPIASAHIDGALYHGDSGTLFAEALVEGGARVAVRATLNVGALDLTGCSRIRLEEPMRSMARRMMEAYRKLGCEQSWTCAPYQAGHRPAFGSDVAWGESNAVVFCNSVLGARTNRYGDFLDIACAIAGRAPDYGLHRPENRRATARLRRRRPAAQPSSAPTIAWPILGSLYGREVGNAVGVVAGVAQPSGRGRAEGVRRGGGLLRRGRPVPYRRRHAGSARPRDGARRTAAPKTMIDVSEAMVADARARLSTATGADAIDAVAIGSPHLSLAEFDAARTPDRRAQARRADPCLHRTPCRGRARSRRPAQAAGKPRRRRRRRHLRRRHADPARA